MADRFYPVWFPGWCLVSGPIPSCNYWQLQDHAWVHPGTNRLWLHRCWWCQPQVWKMSKWVDMSCLVTKPTMWLWAKTQISLGIRPVWSESSLCTQWVAKDPSFLHADSEDSDQTGRMPRLIWVFAGHTLILLVLSCRGLVDIKYKGKYFQ